MEIDREREIPKLSVLKIGRQKIAVMIAPAAFKITVPPVLVTPPASTMLPFARFAANAEAENAKSASTRTVLVLEVCVMDAPPPPKVTELVFKKMSLLLPEPPLVTESTPPTEPIRTGLRAPTTKVPIAGGIGAGGGGAVAEPTVAATILPMPKRADKVRAPADEIVP